MPEKPMLHKISASCTASPLVFKAADKSQPSQVLRAASNVFFALSDAFTKCLCRITHPQFDQDNQKALLACNSIEENYNFSDEVAMELRRRVLTATSHSYRDLSDNSDKRYHKPWIGNDGIEYGEPEPDYGPTSIMTKPQHYVGKDTLRSCAVGELLTKSCEHEPASENSEVQDWLLQIDPARSQEYMKYVAKFQAHGFFRLNDLAEITSKNIEDALSEIGIYRFMHRARLRKAILRINDEKAIDEVW
uniref:Uncharacterized protein AlNc14C187G8361 n=1 Tax=Albugo laibachii Nc14 TaxID=890382 RepID=F0WPL6_9STRA|nr:conserved hypothetical protein [Albugo laibachii Nc14]|eukprot:CCA23266.1 conserved hypothetical protein [Albugo laibachii Nc14]